MMRPFWHNWSIPDKWKDCLSYAMQIKFLAKWLGKVEERVDHIEAGGATVDVYATLTLPAGTDAVVENMGTETNAELLFKIPQGAKGESGSDGRDGNDGTTPHFQIGDVITLLPSEQATASITGTDEEPVLNLGIPQGITGMSGATGEQGARGPQGDRGETGAQGPQGIAGADGVGIQSVAFKETDVQGNNVYTITLTNNHQYDFTANRGPKGEQGIPGDGQDGVGIASITFDEELSSGNQYLITLSNGQSYTFIAPKGSRGDTGATGERGPVGPTGSDGSDGSDGVGISTITFKETDASGNNVYTITLTNGNTYDFTANRGPAGSVGSDGSDGVGISTITFKETDASGNNVYTITLTNGNTYDFTANRGPAGVAGNDGADGVGVPTGGTAGQVLAKVDGTDYNTEWITPSSGGGVTQFSGSGAINGSNATSSVDMRGDITIDEAITSSDTAYVEINATSSHSIMFYRNSASGQQLSSPSFNAINQLGNILKGYKFKMGSNNNLIRIPIMGNDLSTDTVGFGFIDVAVTISRQSDTSYRVIIGMTGYAVNPSTNKYETLYMAVGTSSATIPITLNGFKL